MTKEEIEKIEEKIRKGKPLSRKEWCEGYAVIDGKVTDRHIHDIDDPHDEEAYQEFLKKNSE